MFNSQNEEHKQKIGQETEEEAVEDEAEARVWWRWPGQGQKVWLEVANAPHH